MDKGGHIRPRFLHRAATAGRGVRSNRSHTESASYGGVRDEFGNKSVVRQKFLSRGGGDPRRLAYGVTGAKAQRDVPGQADLFPPPTDVDRIEM